MSYSDWRRRRSSCLWKHFLISDWIYIYENFTGCKSDLDLMARIWIGFWCKIFTFERFNTSGLQLPFVSRYASTKVVANGLFTVSGVSRGKDTGPCPPHSQILQNATGLGNNSFRNAKQWKFSKKCRSILCPTCVTSVVYHRQRSEYWWPRPHHQVEIRCQRGDAVDQGWPACGALASQKWRIAYCR